MTRELAIKRALKQRGLRKAGSLRRLGITEEQARAIINGTPEAEPVVEEVVKKEPVKRKKRTRKKKD